MFTSNPWISYFVIVSTLIAGYYMVIALRFYRHDVKLWLKSRHSITRKVHTEQIDSDGLDPPDEAIEKQKLNSEKGDTEEDKPAAWQSEELFNQVETLASHLKEVIAEAHEKEYGKTDFMLLIQLTLKEYPALHGTPFQFAINNLIEAECAKYGSIHLGVEDKVMIWKQVD